MAAFSHRPYQKGDEEGIVRGFNEAFRTDKSLDYWRAKFEPVGEKSEIMLAVAEDGEIIAQYAMIYLPLWIDGRRYTGGQVCDVYRVVREASRELPVYTKTVEAFFAHFCGPERIHLLFGFPGKRALDLGTRRLGYGTPLPLPYLTAQPGRLDGLLSHLSGYRVERRAGFAELDALWQRADAPVAVQRSVQRAQARYPAERFQQLAASKGGQLAAWSVLQAATPVMRVVDLVWDGADRAALAALNRAWGQAMRKAGCARLEMWLSGHAQLEGALLSLGWTRIPHPLGLHLTIRSWHPDLATGTELTKRMYITWGDSDLV